MTAKQYLVHDGMRLGETTLDCVGYVKDLGFYSKCSGKSLIVKSMTVGSRDVIAFSFCLGLPG